MAQSFASSDLSGESKLTAAIGIPAYPNDLPTIEELREYTQRLLAKISSLGLSAYMRGAEPPYVLQYKERNLNLLPELEADAGEASKEARLALRANVMHENSIKKQT